MARARNIKPGFFRNADLVELPFEARLLFIGLWTIADRSGRLEDRPKQIKMDLFPADSVDVDALLDELAAIGVVARYSHDGKRYLQVVNFAKHQNPHKDEKASTIPDQDGHLAAPEQDKKKHGASTVQAPCNNDSDTVAIGLIPDSLIPDSLIPDSLKEAIASSSASAQPTCDNEPDDGVPPCPFGPLIDLYEAALPVLPTVRRSLFAKGANGKALRARWRWVMTAKHERGERKGERIATTVDEGKAWFGRYFDYVAESDFLSGRSGKFQSCDLGWLVTAANFEKVLSGKYHHEQREAANA